MTGPTAPRFDELIHAPTRLSLVAMLAAARSIDFRYLRDELGLSDSALSKQITSLEQVGYVTVTKTGAGRRGRTTVELNDVGRAAFDGHVAALQQLVGVPLRDPAPARPDLS